ncbi:MAG: TIM barrel protein [Gemmatimonadota bacterium]|nr:TIM barrel protein [Gemmatimonadota bacterium]
MGTVENTSASGSPGGSAPARVGVCSWSLRPATTAALVSAVEATGLGVVQLALEPLRSGAMEPAATQAALAAAGIAVPSAMLAFPGEDYSTLESIRRTGGVVPDAAWPRNLQAAQAAAGIAAEFRVGLVTFHAGFIPHTASDPMRRVVLDRILTIAEPFLARSIPVALETGQENAATLLEALDALQEDRIGVNFDPANMVLYGMGDPVHALELLAPRVLQVHLKDALPAVREGSWGTEVPAGDGAVDWTAFFAVMERHLPGLGVMIERESGESRIEDIRQAAGLASHFLGGLA